MSWLHRLLDRFRPSAGFWKSTGVRPFGHDSLLVAVDGRSYWVQASRQGHAAEYLVWTSDIRDITDAPTVVAAPPASREVVPEISRRLETYFARTRASVRYR